MTFTILWVSHTILLLKVMYSTNNSYREYIYSQFSKTCNKQNFELTVEPRLSRPQLFEPSIIRIQKQLVQSSRNHYYSHHYL